jgi:hypothetical protein
LGFHHAAIVVAIQSNWGGGPNAALVLPAAGKLPVGN